MTYFSRMILMTTLIVAMAGTAVAQQTATDSTEPAETTTAESAVQTETAPETVVAKSSYEVRSEFSQILRESPAELSSILYLDPTLLSNESYMSAYPAISQYVARHPEIARNPRFFLAEFEPREAQSQLSHIVEAGSMLLAFSLMAFAVMWVIRTIIEQKRWNRLSRQQSDVHNKILDRFGTTNEVLDYVRSPAGTKFLESAPIPLHAESPTPNRPVARVLWSIQIGIVVAAAAIGLLLVSFRFDKETAEGLFAMGAILLSIGVGFIGSAAVSMMVSKRLGIWEAQQPADHSLAETGPMR